MDVAGQSSEQKELLLQLQKQIEDSMAARMRAEQANKAKRLPNPEPRREK